MRAWIHDSLYLIASAVIWNWRKSLYRLSGRKKRCPCQNSSDSGRAGESRCEASIHLEVPARFAWVCPALEPTPAGLRCRHSHTQVRPYWTRAIVFTICLLSSIYIVSASAWFGVLRYRGMNEARWHDCIWPGNWPNVAQARGIFFRNLATESLNQRDLSGAIKALSSSIASFSDHWKDGILLARLYEHIGQFAAADQLFFELARKFPEHRETISIQHHDALLASQRYRDLHQLAWMNLTTAQPESWPWFVPILLTTRLLPEPEAIWVNRSAEVASLSDEQRHLLSIVAPISDVSIETIVEKVLSEPSSDPTAAHLRWELLLSVGRREAAIRSIQQDQNTLSRFEYQLAQWATLSPEVSEITFQQYWERAVPDSPSPQQIDRLLVIALKNPRAPLFDSLRAHIPDSDTASLAALWLVSSLNAPYQLPDSLVPLLPLGNDIKTNRLSFTNLREILPGLAAVLPLSREIHYAIITAISDDTRLVTRDR